MPIRPILLYPDERLQRECAECVDLGVARDIAQDLLDTMNAAPPRTVGIAAPQIGAMLRVALIDVARNPKHPPGHGPLALVNPVIAASSGSRVFREGCLSIPQFTANIVRAERVTVAALDLTGAAVEIAAEGFEAVVLQHEIDHLRGIVFLDRVRSVSADLFARKG